MGGTVVLTKNEEKMYHEFRHSIDHWKERNPALAQEIRNYAAQFLDHIALRNSLLESIDSKHTLGALFQADEGSSADRPDKIRAFVESYINGKTVHTAISQSEDINQDALTAKVGMPVPWGKELLAELVKNGLLEQSTDGKLIKSERSNPEAIKTAVTEFYTNTIKNLTIPKCFNDLQPETTEEHGPGGGVSGAERNNLLDTFLRDTTNGVPSLAVNDKSPFYQTYKKFYLIESYIGQGSSFAASYNLCNNLKSISDDAITTDLTEQFKANAHSFTKDQLPLIDATRTLLWSNNICKELEKLSLEKSGELTGELTAEQESKDGAEAPKSFSERFKKGATDMIAGKSKQQRDRGKIDLLTLRLGTIDSIQKRLLNDTMAYLKAVEHSKKQAPEDPAIEAAIQAATPANRNAVLQSYNAQINAQKAKFKKESEQKIVQALMTLEDSIGGLHGTFKELAEEYKTVDVGGGLKALAGKKNRIERLLEDRSFMPGHPTDFKVKSEAAAPLRGEAAVLAERVVSRRTLGEAGSAADHAKLNRP